MSTQNNDNINNIASDIAAQAPNEYHVISSPRELAAISQAAQAGGFYNAKFEDNLAKSLKLSMQHNGYRRMSQPTPPPANIVQQLRSRV